MGFPKWLLFIFIVISLIANAGAISQATTSDQTLPEKAMSLGLVAINTPNNVDDFFAQTITNTVEAESTQAKRVSMGLSIFAGLAFVMVFSFIYNMIGWALGFFLKIRDERQTVLALIGCVLLLFVLTWGFDSIQALYNNYGEISSMLGSIA